VEAQIVSSAIAVIGSLGGALIGGLLQRESKKLRELELKVERFRKEIQARQKEEEVAAELLFMNGAAVSSLAAKRMLRRETEKRFAIRPTVGPREVLPPS